jgi:hypothetical protein
MTCAAAVLSLFPGLLVELRISKGFDRQAIFMAI